jgi:hypothetical protein
VTENNILDLGIVQRERRGKFVLFGELSPDANKEWLITGLLGHAELSVVYGHPGSGKSVFVEDAALRIAAGWEVHGRPVRRGAVLYVALERYVLVKRRAIAFRVKHGLSELPFAIMGGVLDLRDGAQAESIVAVAKEVEAETGEPIVLVIIDTLSRALSGGDENSPKDMGGLVKGTAIVGQGTGAHVLLLHHMPKESESIRGHGALLGAADTTILVSKGASVRTAQVVKANDSQEGESIAFDLESVPVGTDGETTAPVVISADPEPMQRTVRRLSDKHKLAMTALSEVILSDGRLAPTSYGLCEGKQMATVEAWKAELFARGVLDRNAPNPRTDFKRIQDKLSVGGHVGIRDGHIWQA